MELPRIVFDLVRIFGPKTLDVLPVPILSTFSARGGNYEGTSTLSRIPPPPRLGGGGSLEDCSTHDVVEAVRG